ncbi:MAG TPA: PLP-dependent aminotransferase family protein [Dehalococcoidia bacterium]
MAGREETELARWAAGALEGLLAARTAAVRATAPASAAPPSVPLLTLTGGLPDPETLPRDELAEVTRLVLAREGREALQYGGPQGFLGLREVLAERASRREGLELTAENFMLASGSAHALANFCFTFVDPGDPVIVENPSFSGSIRTIRAHQAEVITVPVDREGLRTDALAEALERLAAAGRRAKFIYTIPTFHNPTGSTMTLARRRELLELAARHRVLVLEDDAYGELRYEGEPVPSLYALSGGEGVVRIGTFSKTLASGLRLGWTMARKEYVDALVRMRLDMGTSPFASRVVAEYAASGRLDRHVTRMLALYREKRDTMLSALERYCARWATWERPEGGFFLWLRLAPGADCGTVVRTGLELGVATVAGTGFYSDGDGAGYVRLAFSYVALEEIEEAVRRLGAALARVYEGA